jgi:predicted small lipoprotein YifL
MEVFMKRNKKVFSLVLLLMLLVVSVSGCKTKKHKKPSTVTTTENKTGFVPDENSDDPVDNEMRDDEGNVYELDIQK